MKKIYRGAVRLMFLIIILFSVPRENAFSQCEKHTTQNQSHTTEGINNGIDKYYQNMIIQELAIAGQQAFREVSFRFDYEVSYITNQCTPGTLEIMVLPVALKSYPLYYYGYDISNAVKPDKADLVFHLYGNEGFVADSLLFFDVAVANDTLVHRFDLSTGSEKDLVLYLSFSRAAFHYTKYSYDIFRNRIMQVDRYYAAGMLADSVIRWVEKGFLSETGDKTEMMLRLIELERLIEFVSPENFEAIILREPYDLTGLNAEYQSLIRLHKRMKAIIDYDNFEASATHGISSERQSLKNYLDRFDYYQQLAFKVDFRYTNFIESLAVPGVSHDVPYRLNREFNDKRLLSRSSLQLSSNYLLQGIIDRGNSFDGSANQLRAVSYYKLAYKLSRILKQEDFEIEAYRLICLMQEAISTSYIEISRKAALTDNPALATRYFREAWKLASDETFVFTEPFRISDHENWLYENYENQVLRQIGLKKFSKAMTYLNEIQARCQADTSYQCPEQFNDWMRLTREGFYFDLLAKAQAFMSKGELQDAAKNYGQAVEMRLEMGYRIDKDLNETKLEVTLRQANYEDLFEEGIRYFNREQFVSALFYFNKAYLLERLGLSQAQAGLIDYRQEAARQVIKQALSDGRVKVWANDFEAAASVLSQVNDMLSDYQFGESDTLTSEYLALKSNVYRKECEIISGEFDDLMAHADVARADNDFILAHKITSDAVKLSLDHLNCSIRDSEAWYRKILLEAPAAFQKKEKELDELADKSYSNYLQSFQNLKNYYNRHKLLEQGVVFLPLFDRIVKMRDPGFLKGMLDHYYLQKDYNRSLILLERMRELGIPPQFVSEEQKKLAKTLARRDALNGATSMPWEILRSYPVRGKWYRAFNRAYKFTWLDETNWNFKYWPFLWKK